MLLVVGRQDREELRQGCVVEAVQLVHGDTELVLVEALVVGL
ncbi:MAG TPA: hypothetical protein VFS38_02310 [Actinomycetota bacterium]|nr:hypothetical protein [Actinomycetota bacterium]